MFSAIGIGFTAVYQAAYQEERLFPFSKKATAINCVILVSKTATIGAPFVNELDEPIPIVVVMVIALLSFLILSAFKGKEELAEMQKIEL